MSMNLTCKQVDLWQTPTFITWMCLSARPNGKGVYKQDGGWRGVKFRYLEWVKSCANGAWGTGPQCRGTLEQMKDMQESIEKHVKLLDSFPKLDFSYT